MTDHPLPFFVYGYLKRGGPGHHVVAASLTEVRPATAKGRRVDTGADYPGIVFAADGDDIEGELMFIKEDDFPAIAAQLDDYEQVQAPDRYARVVTTVISAGEPIECYVYHWKGA